jgi:hypothetical protein
LTVDTVIVAETTDIGLATFLHELLTSAGIETELASEGGASVLPGTGAGTYALVVAATDAETARTLVAEAEAGDASAEAAAEEALSERVDDGPVGGGVTDEA